MLGQYWAVLVGHWWYWVSVAWYCLVLGDTGLVKGLYILKRVEIWSGVTIVGRRRQQPRKDRAIRTMDHGRLRWAKNVIVVGFQPRDGKVLSSPDCWRLKRKPKIFVIFAGLLWTGVAPSAMILQHVSDSLVLLTSVNWKGKMKVALPQKLLTLPSLFFPN